VSELDLRSVVGEVLAGASMSISVSAMVKIVGQQMVCLLWLCSWCCSRD
jgi:hypothetical protein